MHSLEISFSNDQYETSQTNIQNFDEPQNKTQNNIAHRKRIYVYIYIYIFFFFFFEEENE